MDTNPALQPGPLVKGAIFGSYAGCLILIASIELREGVWPDFLPELWALPIILLIYGGIASIFAAFGLIVFGMPIALVFGRRATAWPFLPLVIGWAGLAGHLALSIIATGPVGWSPGDIARGPGALFGVTCAVFYRGYLKRAWTDQARPTALPD
ncbi:hypothetical protein [Novosphingobium olei]|uniref:Uncharacterized protein n=1 Tax=Novosphingobium olei TaxID=2728851 RepID=A0A7Y0BRQ8_9SPHN|nr:hypothetical protein [Novosphingobium olei]NML95223.1 hypothetical protein [Novosphingobium olei]